jgi:hypothetical protein
MHYDPYHNHKWAKNLAHARRLREQGETVTFYRGEDLPDNDVYPGMRVMAAYWTSVEHEMRMRLKMLLDGAGHPGWMEDQEILQQRDLFVGRFHEDMRTLIEKDKIFPIVEFDHLVSQDYDLPEDWVPVMQSWQATSEAALDADHPLAPEQIESWFRSCLRSVANYNRYLIWGGVCAAALVRREGEEALRAAIDNTSEQFKWEISREFYVNVMPAAGFEDVGDVMELGMRGMYSDQYYQSGEDEEVGEKTIKQSRLLNCELAGIFQRVADWNDLPTLALGYGICRYCEVHGEATMLITMPPMYSPGYKLLESIGLNNKTCIFELTLTPADDMERLMTTHAKVFGSGDDA